MALRSLMRERLLENPIKTAALILPTGIYSRMRQVKVWMTYIDGEGVTQEKTVTLDPASWHVRVVSYKTRKTQLDGTEERDIVTVAVEDIVKYSEADDWKEMIIIMRRWKQGGVETARRGMGIKTGEWPKPEEEKLLMQVFYLWHWPPNNVAKVWYKDELVYDSEVDGWRKPWIWLPW